MSPSCVAVKWVKTQRMALTNGWATNGWCITLVTSFDNFLITRVDPLIDYCHLHRLHFALRD